VARLIHVSVNTLPAGTRLSTSDLPNSVRGWVDLCEAITRPTDLLRLVAPVALIECVYEYVREQQFPDKPTRVSSAFACGRPESAMYFALMYRNRNARFYEVEAIGPAWISDMALINPGPDWTQPTQRAIGDLLDLARRYWTTVSTDLETELDLPEVILPQSATVQRPLIPPFLR
jgi:hypothetical protein